MNKKQKIVVITAGLILLSVITVWLIYGAEIFTKTEVLVESKDELFGWIEKKWIDKFVWGLDLTLIVSIVTLLTGGFLIYIFRRKKD